MSPAHVRRQRPHSTETVTARVPSGTINMGDRLWKFVVAHMDVAHAKSSPRPRCKRERCTTQVAAHNPRRQVRQCRRALCQCPGAARCARRTGCTRGSVASAPCCSIPIPRVCCASFFFPPPVVSNNVEPKGEQRGTSPTTQKNPSEIQTSTISTGQAARRRMRKEYSDTF